MIVFFNKKMENSKLFYLNANFDLIFSGNNFERYLLMVDEISVCFQILGEKRDRVFLKIKPFKEYYDYLDLLNVTYAQIVKKNENLSKFIPKIWGFNKESTDFLNSEGISFSCPNLDIIKMINSKEYSSKIAQKLKYNSSIICFSEEEVYEKISNFNDFPIVVKSSFGSAGAGFIIKNSLDWTKGEKKKLRRIFENKSEVAIIEKWEERIADFSISFNLLKNGSIDEILYNQTIINDKGVFHGVFPDSKNKELLNIKAKLEKTGNEISKILFNDGYYGPVGIDSYLFKNGDGVIKLNPLSEINGRLTMVDIPRILKKRYGNPEFTVFLSFPRQKLSYLSTYLEFFKIFDNYRFDGRYGILLVTPLKIEYKDEIKSPTKYFFYVAAESKEKLHKYIEYIKSR